MKYITLFETAAAYNAATLDLPNVSLIEENMSVIYNPYVPETRVVAKYNVTSTSSSTILRASYENNIFKSMEIDGVMLDGLVTAYTFDTIGEHIVKYELYDETKLGNQAPVFCSSNLIECFIPDSVTSIGNNAFLNCSGLTSIDIPDSVTSIGQDAFGGCSSLTSVIIGSGVTSIGNGAFASGNSLSSITVDSNNTTYDSKNNCNAIIQTSTNMLIQGCNSTVIPNSVTSIGEKAFAYCSDLTSIDIPSGVTYIGNNAFTNCSGITSIDIPSGVTHIGERAFQNCSSLTSIDIPDSVTSIGDRAFASCAGLTNMTVDSNNTTYDSRNNCNAIIQTSTNTLIQGCKNTVIPNSITSIGNNAFLNCSGLTSIDIPDSVTSIGQDAFSGCSSLTSVIIGSGVTSIGNGAFYNCSGLTSIVSNAATAPTIKSSTFRNTKTNGTLTVPSGSTGYDVWMGTGNYYLGSYNWTKVEQ